MRRLGLWSTQEISAETYDARLIHRNGAGLAIKFINEALKGGGVAISSPHDTAFKTGCTFAKWDNANEVGQFVRRENAGHNTDAGTGSDKSEKHILAVAMLNSFRFKSTDISAELQSQVTKLRKRLQAR